MKQEMSLTSAEPLFISHDTYKKTLGLGERIKWVDKGKMGKQITTLKSLCHELLQEDFHSYFLPFFSCTTLGAFLIVSSLVFLPGKLYPNIAELIFF